MEKSNLTKTDENADVNGFGLAGSEPDCSEISFFSMLKERNVYVGVWFVLGGTFPVAAISMVFCG